jgi:hypothetical protein
MTSKLVLPLLLLASGCSGIHTLELGGATQTTLAEIRTAPLRELPARGMVVRVPSGSVLPVRIGLDLTALVLEPGENRLRVNQDVWLYISTRSFELSPDGVRWAKIQDVRALKKLFGLASRGAFSFGFGFDKKGKPLVNLALHQPR